MLGFKLASFRILLTATNNIDKEQHWLEKACLSIGPRDFGGEFGYQDGKDKANLTINVTVSGLARKKSNVEILNYYLTEIFKKSKSEGWNITYRVITNMKLESPNKLSGAISKVKAAIEVGEFSLQKEVEELKIELIERLSKAMDILN